MLSRPLQSAYSEGLPLQVPLAHNVPRENVIAVGAAPTLNLPARMVMVDPSDRLTWPWQYQLGAAAPAGSTPSAAGAGLRFTAYGA